MATQVNKKGDRKQEYEIIDFTKFMMFKLA